MAREVTFQSKPIPAVSLLALALGAAAFGAVAIGALAIGRLAVGRLVIKKARFSALEVDELTVRRLRVVEHEGPSLLADDERSARRSGPQPALGVARANDQSQRLCVTESGSGSAPRRRESSVEEESTRRVVD
jgi:hypothetical protein